MNSLDASADLFAEAPAGPALPVTYRQGIVISYDTTTGANQVLVGGTVLTDLPILNTSEALLLSPGAVVGILVAGPTFAILGRLTVPGTPEALSALSAIRLQSAIVAANEATSSTTYGDLSSIGPTIDFEVPFTGRVLMFVVAQIRWSLADDEGGGQMSVQLSGANIAAPSGEWALLSYTQVIGGNTSNQGIHRACAVYPFTGLTPGLTTFTAKYRAVVSGLSCQFEDRMIALMAL